MTATTNVLVALKNILDRNSSYLTPIFRSNGTANAAGDSLEYFVQVLHNIHTKKRKKIFIIIIFLGQVIALISLILLLKVGSE